MPSVCRAPARDVPTISEEKAVPSRLPSQKQYNQPCYSHHTCSGSSSRMNQVQVNAVSIVQITRFQSPNRLSRVSLSSGPAPAALFCFSPPEGVREEHTRYHEVSAGAAGASERGLRAGPYALQQRQPRARSTNQGTRFRFRFRITCKRSRKPAGEIYDRLVDGEVAWEGEEGCRHDACWEDVFCGHLWQE